jgi:hypothetical protein
VSKKRDTDVYQHLLRQMRGGVAYQLGTSDRTDRVTTSVLQAAVMQAAIELDAVIELLEEREHRRQSAEAPLSFVLLGIRRRLDFAAELDSGMWDPDRPYVTASAAEFHPDGVEAGMRAGREQDPENIGNTDVQAKTATSVSDPAANDGGAP